jgi:hypothetical protein
MINDFLSVDSELFFQNLQTSPGQLIFQYFYE